MRFLLRRNDKLSAKTRNPQLFNPQLFFRTIVYLHMNSAIP